MMLRKDLLDPIPGDNPSGLNVRRLPQYDQIAEALRQDDDLPRGEWQESERKVANYPLASDLSQDALATNGKHLQVAAWLTEALLHQESFGGLKEGLDVCYGLVDGFWDTVYPLGEDGDWGARAKPLQWIGNKLGDSARKAPLTSSGISWYKIRESRQVGYEKDAQSDAAKKAREKAIKEGKVTAEAFEKSFSATPKSFYAKAETDLDACLASLARLDHLCEEKFGEDPPSFAVLRGALEEIRRDVHGFLDRKRAIEPDPVTPPAEKEPYVPPTQTQRAPEVQPQTVSPARPLPFVPLQIPSPPNAENADGDPISTVMMAAAQLRSNNPYSPASYLMLRGLRWGELRAALAASDLAALESPPTEVRQHVKRLAISRQWKELLEYCETVMSLPSSRAWLDLQRFVVEACAALGEEYNAIALAIRSELRALIRDYPELLDARLMDDTAVANVETQTWLRGLAAEPENGRADIKTSNGFVDAQIPGWQRTFIDSSVLASEALQTGQEKKAFEILFRDLERQRSGRGRFQRKLQLIQLCVSAGKDAIAQPLLDDVMSSIDNHKLEDWEDRELIAGALATVMESNKKIAADAKEKQKLFERICRLDPVRALGS